MQEVDLKGKCEDELAAGNRSCGVIIDIQRCPKSREQLNGSDAQDIERKDSKDDKWFSDTR